MIHLHWLVFALASIGWESAAHNCSDENYASAYDALFEHLDLDNIQMNKRRPLNYKTLTMVYVNLFVSSIIEVNEKAQSFSTQVKMDLSWVNEKMNWEAEDFCGVYLVAVQKDSLWTPDIVILEGISTEFGTKESPYVQLYDLGFIVSSEVLSLTTACKMDLYKFPFDIQSCNLTLQSSAYSYIEMFLLPFTDGEESTLVSKETFQAQGEWELVSIENTYSFAYTLWGRKSQVLNQITIKRRPLLYVINIIVPVFFFLVLDVASYFMDASGADKLSFKVTLLLSISVLLLIVNDTLPSTADKIPLIGIYCSGIFILIGISILETILVNFLISRGVEKKSVETTAVVTGRDDAVRDLQILTECRTATQQNQQETTSLCWTKTARIIDVTFLILYIITIIVFLSMLGKLWFK